jgi:hypothetical protein
MTIMGMIKNYRRKYAEKHPGPWSVEITENYNTSIGQIGGGWTKYRAVIRDRDGKPLRVLQGPSYRMLHRGAEKHAERHGVELVS